MITVLNNFNFLLGCKYHDQLQGVPGEGQPEAVWVLRLLQVRQQAQPHRSLLSIPRFNFGANLSSIGKNAD